MFLAKPGNQEDRREIADEIKKKEKKLSNRQKKKTAKKNKKKKRVSLFLIQIMQRVNL
jgi:hypothetical protein